MAKRKSKHLQN